MSYGTPDLYYQPEQFGLTMLGEIEWSEPCYDFDLTAVWVDADKKLYWASDSGCSCPSPFEGFTSVADAETGDFAALEQALTNGPIRTPHLRSLTCSHVFGRRSREHPAPDARPAG